MRPECRFGVAPALLLAAVLYACSLARTYLTVVADSEVCLVVPSSQQPAACIRAVDMEEARLESSGTLHTHLVPVEPLGSARIVPYASTHTHSGPGPGPELGLGLVLVRLVAVAVVVFVYEQLPLVAVLVHQGLGICLSLAEVSLEAQMDHCTFVA